MTKKGQAWQLSTLELLVCFWWGRSDAHVISAGHCHPSHRTPWGLPGSKFAIDVLLLVALGWHRIFASPLQRSFRAHRNHRRCLSNSAKWKKRNQNAMATQEAYFVPRSEILAWINSTLGMRISKVEEVSMCWQGHQSRPAAVCCPPRPPCCVVLNADCQRCCGLSAAGCTVPKHSAHEEGTVHTWGHAVRLLGFICSKLLTAVRACRWTSTQRMSMT